MSGQALQNHIFQWVFTQFRMTHIQHLDAPRDDFPEPTVPALLNAAATTAAPVEDPFVFLTVKKNTGKFMLTPVKLEDAHRLTFDSLLKLAAPLPRSRSSFTHPVIYLGKRNCDVAHPLLTGP